MLSATKEMEDEVSPVLTLRILTILPRLEGELTFSVVIYGIGLHSGVFWFIIMMMIMTMY